MGNGASVSQPVSSRTTEPYNQRFILPSKKCPACKRSPNRITCISTENVSTDLSRLPEKVFRVLVDPSGKGYTVDELGIDLNVSIGKLAYLHKADDPTFNF